MTVKHSAINGASTSPSSKLRDYCGKIVRFRAGSWFMMTVEKRISGHPLVASVIYLLKLGWACLQRVKLHFKLHTPVGWASGTWYSNGEWVWFQSPSDLLGYQGKKLALLKLSHNDFIRPHNAWKLSEWQWGFNEIKGWIIRVRTSYNNRRI